MNIDIDCIRKVIKYYANNLDYHEGIDNTWGEDFVDLNMLYQAKELEKFPKKDIMYSVLKLAEYKSKETLKEITKKAIIIKEQEISSLALLILIETLKVY